MRTKRRKLAERVFRSSLQRHGAEPPKPFSGFERSKEQGGEGLFKTDRLKRKENKRGRMKKNIDQKNKKNINKNGKTLGMRVHGILDNVFTCMSVLLTDV